VQTYDTPNYRLVFIRPIKPFFLVCNIFSENQKASETDDETDVDDDEYSMHSPTAYWC